MRRSGAVGAVIVFFALVFITAQGCGGHQTAPETAPSAVRIPIPADPESLSFATAKGRWSLILTELIGDSLVGLDRNMKVVPRLAESWSWSEDHLHLTFHLRKGATWHDGRPVTSTDVVHTWEVLADPSTGTSSWTPAFAPIRRVEATGEFTVRVDYDKPFAAALTGWGAPLVPAHRPLDDPKTVGCGPWILERWDRGERIVLRANRAHYLPPRVDRLVMEILPDPGTRFKALRAGQLDICGLLPAQWQAARKDPELMSRLDFFEYRILYFFFIAWKDAGPDSLFHDPRVRRAMTEAIDRQGFLDRFMGGLGQVAVTAFHPDGWAYDPQLEPWPYDPADARRLLSSAGWLEPGGGGVRESAGRPFRFKLTYPLGSSETENIATYVQSQLAEVGVRAVLEPLEWALFLQRIRQEKNYDAVMTGWGLDVDPDPFDLFHSSQTGPGGANYAFVRDETIDALIERARETFDRPRRRELYWSIQRRLHELEPQTVLFYPTSRMGHDRRLKGVEGSPLGPLRFIPGSCAWRWQEGGNQP